MFDIHDGELKLRTSQAFGGVTDLRSIANAANGDNIFATDGANNRLYFLTYSKQITLQQTLTNGSNGVAGLAGASGLAVSPDGKFVYVAAAIDNAVSAFQLSGGRLTEVGIYREGTLGAHGLIGARALALLDTPFGHSLVCAGTTSNSLAVFQRDPVLGR